MDLSCLPLCSVSIDDEDDESADDRSGPKPPTPPPRKSGSFRKRLPCFCKQDSHEWPMLDTRGSGASSSDTERRVRRRSETPPFDEPPSQHRQRQRALSHIAASLRFAPVPAMAVAGFITDPGFLSVSRTPSRQGQFRASYHGKASDKKYLESNYMTSLDGRKPFADVVGSAESLVGRVLYEQGLGKYCDPDFVRATQRELAEAFNMTQEEMDRAAHRILEAESRSPSRHANNQDRTPSPAADGDLRIEDIRGALGGAVGGIMRGDQQRFFSDKSFSSEDEDDKYRDTKL